MMTIFNGELKSFLFQKWVHVILHNHKRIPSTDFYGSSLQLSTNEVLDTSHLAQSIAAFSKSLKFGVYFEHFSQLYQLFLLLLEE